MQIAIIVLLVLELVLTYLYFNTMHDKLKEMQESIKANIHSLRHETETGIKGLKRDEHQILDALKQAIITLDKLTPPLENTTNQVVGIRKDTHDIVEHQKVIISSLNEIIFNLNEIIHNQRNK